MKRPLILTAFSVLLVFSVIVIPVCAIRPNYIYDNAEIIDDTHKRLITDYLIELDKNTTAEIVIYTLESLEGKTIEDKADEIFNHTPLDGVIGIGKKDKDNGILILVAVKDRKWRIEIGYGLEGIITDATAGRIGREYLTTYFKQGKYGEGFYKAVQALGEKIRKGPIEEKPSEIDPAVVQALWFILLGILLAIFWIIFVFKVIKPAMKWNRERKRKKVLRKQLTVKIQELEKKINEYDKGIDSLDDDIQHLPQWAKDEIRGQMGIAYSYLEKIRMNISSAKALLKRDPDESKTFLKGVKVYGQRIDASLTKILVDLPQKLEQYKKEAPQKIQQAQFKVAQTEKFLKSLEKKGFRVKMWMDSLEEVKRTLDVLQKDYRKTTLDFRPICESADKALGKTEKISTFSHQMLERYEKASSLLNRLPHSIWVARNSLKSGSVALEKLKSEAPKRVWTQIEYNFSKIPSLLKMAEGCLEEARKLNSMEIQKFDEALEECNKAANIVDKATTYLADIEKKRREIKESKSRSGTLLEQAENKVKVAERKVLDSDVKSYPRKLARQARERLQDAKREMANQEMIDWLFVVAVLNESISLAKIATKKAEDDIEKAEEERRRRRRRRERESYWSSRSSYGGYGGGSSGGFGGGFSGGGGASGGW